MFFSSSLSAPIQMSRRLALKSAACVVGLALITRQAFAGEVFTGLVDGVGAGGYDVVAYFAQGRPTEGSTQFTHSWNGATWRFASAANRDSFAANPARYAPAYGGHCAWAASQGYRAKGDPMNWRIVDGRLFLNYNAEVQQRWNASYMRFIREADTRWPRLRNG